MHGSNQTKTVLFALMLTAGACGGGGDNDNDPTASGGGLVLDFTAFVEGAVQVSGVASSEQGGLAVVTDFERVVVIDPSSAAAIDEFSVQFGDLPQQGSSEALIFTANGDLAVLYPDHKTVRTFSNGQAQGDVDLSAVEGPIHGAMTIDPALGRLYVVSGDQTLALIEIDANDGTVRSSQPITGDLDVEVTGLSTAINDASLLWAVAADNRVFDIDTMSGQSRNRGTLSEVGEASGCEAFINAEDEAVLSVSDDDDQYNAQPGPIRLYLLD